MTSDILPQLILLLLPLAASVWLVRAYLERFRAQDEVMRDFWATLPGARHRVRWGRGHIAELDGERLGVSYDVFTEGCPRHGIVPVWRLRREASRFGHIDVRFCRTQDTEPSRFDLRGATPQSLTLSSSAAAPPFDAARWAPALEALTKKFVLRSLSVQGGGVELAVEADKGTLDELRDALRAFDALVDHVPSLGPPDALRGEATALPSPGSKTGQPVSMSLRPTGAVAATPPVGPRPRP